MLFNRSNGEAPTQLPAVIPPIPLTPVNPQTVRAVSVLSFSELLELKDHVDRELKHRGEQELSGIREKIQAIAALQGLSVDDLLNPPKAKAKREPAAVKYRNPDNPEQTWTGKGRTPTWLQEKLDAEIPLGHFEI